MTNNNSRPLAPKSARGLFIAAAGQPIAHRNGHNCAQRLPIAHRGFLIAHCILQFCEDITGFVRIRNKIALKSRNI